MPALWATPSTGSDPSVTSSVVVQGWFASSSNQLETVRFTTSAPTSASVVRSATLSAAGVNALLSAMAGQVMPTTDAWANTSSSLKTTVDATWVNP